MAFGLTVVAFGALLTDGGFGAALMRLEEVAPRQLQAVYGAQLLIATLVTAATVAIAAPLGHRRRRRRGHGALAAAGHREAPGRADRASGG